MPFGLGPIELIIILAIILLAFGAKGQPAVVMSIIFAGAPIVNAVVALAIHPPAGGLSSLRWQFVAGILLAAIGGTPVLLAVAPGCPTAEHGRARRACRCRRSSRRAADGKYHSDAAPGCE